MTERDLSNWHISLRVASLAPNTGMVPVRCRTLLSVQAEIERLRAERDAARAALAELVRLKDLKDRLTQLHEMGHGTDYGTYHAGKAAAWSAARSVLAASKEKT